MRSYAEVDMGKSLCYVSVSLSVCGRGCYSMKTSATGGDLCEPLRPIHDPRSWGHALPPERAREVQSRARIFVKNLSDYPAGTPPIELSPLFFL